METHRRATRALQSRTSPDYSHEHINGDQTPQFLVGLTIAGLASTLLTTIYELFYVDVFLRVYELPLGFFGTGTFCFRSSALPILSLELGWWMHMLTNLLGAPSLVFRDAFLPCVSSLHSFAGIRATVAYRQDFISSCQYRSTILYSPSHPSF